MRYLIVGYSYHGGATATVLLRVLSNGKLVGERITVEVPCVAMQPYVDAFRDRAIVELRLVVVG